MAQERRMTRGWKLSNYVLIITGRVFPVTEKFSEQGLSSSTKAHFLEKKGANVF